MITSDTFLLTYLTEKSYKNPLNRFKRSQIIILNGPSSQSIDTDLTVLTLVYAILKLRPYLYGADFTVYTDHKPLTSLFMKEMQNTKIQRWAVLLSEYGATIKYCKGKNNIPADMLSRIPPEPGIHTIDCDDPTAIPEQDAADVLPLLYDGLNLDYTLIKGRLFNISLLTPNSASYPRLVSPAAYRERVIKIAYKKVGHMATGEALACLREAYV